MRCLKVPEGRRALFAFPYPIAIWRDPPRSVELALRVAEDFGARRIYTVGDVVTKNFLAAGARPDAAAVDLKTRRGEFVKMVEAFPRVLRVKNPPGYITEDAWAAVREAVGSPGTLILVDGEEDMLSLAFIALAPEDSAVVYGHYRGALIIIPVGAYKEIRRLLDYMEGC
ncbi:MAG: DUF359 domain-containing protein [Thermoproteus sp.]